MYRTVVIEYSHKAKKTAKSIEDKANEMAEKGYELITVTSAGRAKTILVFSGNDRAESEEKTK